MAESNEMTINLAVLGRTQTGKSAAGNSLLGSYDFESHLSPSSVTTCCSLGCSSRISGVIRRNGCELALRVRVLDTPSYPHSSLSKEQVQRRVRAALAQHFREGLHLALLVLRADLPLCPDENDHTIQFIQELLGPTWKDFTAVLLTHADRTEEAGFSEDAYLHSASSTLLSLLSSVQHKYIFLDNQKSIIKEERATILSKLLNFIRKNNYQLLLLKHTKE
ncbi:GTPase IMAP family member GIMD1 [Struthio camelus australis]|uniref:GTPase IMAP family member GIMD1 n=1 Tax=Struthio camelus australis TaxID=441894 RepID=A0A093ICH2_STRCA|nr:PREDICTED: GTPase IMAP family member GIMD1 [Struthio camelus australis]XP_009687666.1 PREDICTED: GTPase IMAP family member GIMD1 [Struthio camelus australis]XP_009687667.1 PREDICTED: GTPase IMAP family member GIMD1 [Struthio camelus australis]XP_009687668.1 PREDICTED: GTPase IMAP family member GIMD1 [Struthio camelus australis]KFV88817.1 GTPase IMAP family member GIMD1 [Struthio camelus australis]